MAYAWKNVRIFHKLNETLSLIYSGRARDPLVVFRIDIRQNDKNQVKNRNLNEKYERHKSRDLFVAVIIVTIKTDVPECSCASMMCVRSEYLIELKSFVLMFSSFCKMSTTNFISFFILDFHIHSPCFFFSLVLAFLERQQNNLFLFETLFCSEWLYFFARQLCQII